MTEAKIVAVVLAAGKGTRMKSDRPKVLHGLAGRPMIAYVLENLKVLGPARTVVVIGPGMEDVAAAVAPVPTVVQERQLGTADAVSAAREAWDGVAGDVLVLFGDTPLIGPDTLSKLVAARRAAPRPAVVVLGMRLEAPGEYGRLVTGPGGALEAIVEHADADAEQRALALCNSGVMMVDGTVLGDLLGGIGNDNAKGEYYLTDIVAIAREKGLACGVVDGPAAELLGINSRADLAAAEAVMQTRLRGAAMAQGATLTDPASVHMSFDTRLGRDVVIGPNVVFGPGVTVAEEVEIRPFCHLEGASVAAGAVIGPFARLRPGAVIGAGAWVGNFVEIKNARVEAGAKVSHLSYIGDAHVGAGANIGAGTITCNYDGFEKSHTEIGAGAFIGSNTALVAPVTVGRGAIVGAGSVITRDIADESLAVARAEQTNSEGGATRFKEVKRVAQTPGGTSGKARARRRLRRSERE